MFNTSNNNVLRRKRKTSPKGCWRLSPKIPPKEERTHQPTTVYSLQWDNEQSWWFPLIIDFLVVSKQHAAATPTAEVGQPDDLSPLLTTV